MSELKRAFISYRDDGESAAENVERAISEHGHFAFRDNSLLGHGDVWEKRLHEEIERADLFVTVLSKSVLDGDNWWLKELTIAWTHSPPLRILPLRIIGKFPDPSVLPDQSPALRRLKELQWFNFDRALWNERACSRDLVRITTETFLKNIGIPERGPGYCEACYRERADRPVVPIDGNGACPLCRRQVTSRSAQAFDLGLLERNRGAISEAVALVAEPDQASSRLNVYLTKLRPSTNDRMRYEVLSRTPISAIESGMPPVGRGASGDKAASDATHSGPSSGGPFDPHATRIANSGEAPTLASADRTEAGAVADTDGPGDGPCPPEVTGFGRAGGEPRREFLGWDVPLPEAAAERFFVARSSDITEIDASNEIWVFSGARAGREFLRRIAERCRDEGWSLIPPQVLTMGHLCESLLDATDRDGGVATDDELRVAWESVLSTFRRSDDREPGTDQPEDPVDDMGLSRDWMVAAMSAAAELRGEGWTPTSFSRALGASHPDQEQWRSIARLDEQVAEALAAAGLLDPFEDRRRRVAEAPLRSYSVFVAGVVELSGWQRHLLTRASAVCLVAAPERLRDDFDHLGSVISERWIGRDVGVDPERVVVVESDRSAVEAAAVAIDNWASEISRDRLTICVADPALGPKLSRDLPMLGIPVHVPLTRPFAESALGRLLVAAGALVRHSTATTTAVASLVRHPLFSMWATREDADRLAPILGRAIVWLRPRTLDDLVTGLKGTLLGSDSRSSLNEADRSYLVDALERVARWHSDWSDRKSLVSEWAVRLGEWLRELIARNPFQESAEDCRLLAGDVGECVAVLDSLTKMPAAFQVRLTANEFLELLVESAGKRSASSDTSAEGAIEAVGWLEIASDPSPNIVVVGMHDGAVPGGAALDRMLPESLRRRFGFTTQDVRQARDALVLSTLAARCDRLCIIVPVASGDGTPQLPSRLLLAGAQDATARRIIRFSRPSHVRLRLPQPAAPGFHRPDPDPQLPIPSEMSSTSLRLYLIDPYRFYLRFVQGLPLKFVEDLERPDTEALDAIEFGALLHNVLECATRDDGLRLETAPERIDQQFADLLSQCSSDRFGSKRPTRIRVQERMLRRRLSAFAIVEAESRRSGWFTHEVEWRFRRGLSFGDSGDQQQIVGRIDRIDRHVETGRVRVLDYKSGEAGASPVSSHRIRDASGGWRWIDLQLPIYRHFLAEATGVPPDQIDVGYASIPRSIRDTRIVVASEWGQADFADAIQTARGVVAAIHRREFASSGSPWSDVYANLCSMPGTPREMVQEGRAR